MSNDDRSVQNKATVEKMWTALSEFDFDTLKSCLHPEVHYEDVPTEDAGAIGPENVVARLSVAWDHIDKQIQTTHRIAAGPVADSVLRRATARQAHRTRGRGPERTL